MRPIPLPRWLDGFRRTRRQFSLRPARATPQPRAPKPAGVGRPEDRGSRTEWYARPPRFRPRRPRDSSGLMRAAAARRASVPQSAPEDAPESQDPRITGRAGSSEFSIAHAELRWLVESGTTAPNPVRRPFDHFGWGDGGIAKELVGFRGVTQKRGPALLARENRFNSKQLRELVRDVSDRKRFGASEVQNCGRRRTKAEGAQTNRIRVTLPDHIDKAHPEINGAAFKHSGADIEKHAIAQIDGVIEP